MTKPKTQIEGHYFRDLRSRSAYYKIVTEHVGYHIECLFWRDDRNSIYEPVEYKLAVFMEGDLDE